jgi:hypothetical protein
MRRVKENRIGSPVCGVLVAGGLCYRRLSDDGESPVSRKVHRLLRVPPTGSSASGALPVLDLRHDEQ